MSCLNPDLKEELVKGYYKIFDNLDMANAYIAKSQTLSPQLEEALPRFYPLIRKHQNLINRCQLNRYNKLCGKVCVLKDGNAARKLIETKKTMFDLLIISYLSNSLLPIGEEVDSDMPEYQYTPPWEELQKVLESETGLQFGKDFKDEYATNENEKERDDIGKKLIIEIDSPMEGEEKS